MKILGIIPARFASTRFMGKPLVDIAGKPMIQRVYEQAKKAQKLSEVIVATDHKDIKAQIESIGGKAVMTSDAHESGTERCGEVLCQLKNKEEFEYVVNIQGDEPFINPQLIDDLCQLLDHKTEIATSVIRIKDYETLKDPNVVKVVLTTHKRALYFSRQMIPFVRGIESENWLDHAQFFKHIGIYAYRKDVLEQIVKLPPDVLENTEKLEQLRWLGHGYQIRVKETEFESVGIDTLDDLKKLNLEK